MEIIIYRHAEPIVSSDEVISGRDFISWVQKYNESGIRISQLAVEKEELVHTSTLIRSYETGMLIGKEVIRNRLFREAEIPLLSFPAVHLKAKFWLFVARLLWLFGFRKNCESFKDAKKRAEEIVDKIELLGFDAKRMVLVGHGFINLLIKKEFIKRNCTVIQTNDKNDFLSKMIIKTEPNHSRKRGQNYF